MENTISFPGIGINCGRVNPVAFYVFGHHIMWYGIIIAVGFFLAFIYCSKRAKKFDVKEENFSDFILYATPIAVVCARIYYVLFNYELYSDNMASVFEIWNGGLGIYGGIIGAAVTLIIFCKIKKISLSNMFDLCSLGLLIGQGIGRWGNFVNAEAYGTETSLPWAMSINGGKGVHPTFLYESLWCLLGFLFIHKYSKKERKSGNIFLVYLIWYGIGRFFIEGLRTDSLYLWGTQQRVSQLIAAISVVASVAIYICRNYIAEKNKIK